jgi:tetratricopeptide (TPR) repeat protein
VPPGWRSARTKGLLAILLLIALIGVGNWRWSYVTWQIQAARHTLRQGDANQALEILVRAERFQPERAELLYLLGRAYRQVGKFDSAARYLNLAERGGWDAKELRHQRTLAQLQLGNVEQAEAYLQEILQDGASDERAREFFAAHAQGLLRNYRLSDALVCLDFWIDWRPDEVQARLWRADIWERILRWSAAADEYRTILEMDPDQLPARRRLARSLFELHENQAALDQFERCLKADPTDVESSIGAAKCYRRLSDNTAEAERRLQVLITENQSLTKEQRADILTELGQLAMERRQFTEAVRLLSEATALEPANAGAHHNLGRAYAGQGNLELSQVHLEESRQIYAHYGRLSDIMRDLLTNPRDPELRWEAGNLFLELGLEREGVAWMTTALHYDADHLPTHRSLAEYYTNRGNHDLASKHAGRIVARRASKGPPRPQSFPAP